jgi:CelD/BcsL family acetyltransferase involved in cellulose biosynthesis
MHAQLFETLDEARDIWRAFERDAACYVFQTYDWQRLWYNCMGAQTKVCILVLSDVTGPLMLCPLAIERRHGIRLLRFLGGPVTDYHAPMLRRGSEVAATEVWTAIVGGLPTFDLAWFEKMPVDIEDSANPFIQLPHAHHTSNAYSADLGRSYDEYRACHSAAFFRDTRRHRRRLSEVGTIRYEVAGARTDEIMAALVKQKTRRYRDTGAPDLFQIPGLLQFYQALARMPFGHLSALRVNDDIVAAHLGAVFRRRIYWLMPTFEVGPWEKFSTGRLLLEDLMQWGYGHDVRIFDLTFGDEPYKLKWSDKVTPLYETLIPATYIGAAYCETTHAGQAIHRRFRRIYRGAMQLMRSQ